MNTLFYDYYNSNSPERQSEIDRCAMANFSIGFKRIIAFGNKNIDLANSSHILKAPLNSRLTFSNFLSFVDSNQHSTGVAILTNSDIMLDPRIIELTSDLEKNILLALSRHEADLTLVEYPWCTQDTWILKFQSIHKSAIIACQFYLGTPGCELRFAEALYASGFTVYNPSLSIRNLHNQSISSVHYDNDRHYGAYIFTPPCFIEQVKERDNSLSGKLCYLRKGNNLFQIHP